MYIYISIYIYLSLSLSLRGNNIFVCMYIYIYIYIRLDTKSHRPRELAARNISPTGSSQPRVFRKPADISQRGSHAECFIFLLTPGRCLSNHRHCTRLEGQDDEAPVGVAGRRPKYGEALSCQ